MFEAIICYLCNHSHIFNNLYFTYFYEEKEPTNYEDLINY